jgi:hypothetical protein
MALPRVATRWEILKNEMYNPVVHAVLPEPLVINHWQFEENERKRRRIG